MKYILAGVDGTGSQTWLPESGGSAVLRFVGDFDAQGGDKAYFHGPSHEATGSDSGAILQSVLGFIHGAYQRATNIRLPWDGPPDLPIAQRERNRRQILDAMSDQVVKIVLVGHSRGGLIAILAAARLQPPVEFLGLFDAVDRVFGPDAGTIRNVRTTYHALRHPAMDSRSYFGNTGRRSEGRYVERMFRTSHGGVGGAVEVRPTGMFSDGSCAEHYEIAQMIANAGRGTLALEGPVGTRAALCTAESRHAERWLRDGAVRAGLRFV